MRNVAGGGEAWQIGDWEQSKLAGTQGTVLCTNLTVHLWVTEYSGKDQQESLVWYNTEVYKITMSMSVSS